MESRITPHSVIGKVLDDSHEVNQFKLLSHYYDDCRSNTFGKDMIPLSSMDMG